MNECVFILKALSLIQILRMANGYPTGEYDSPPRNRSGFLKLRDIDVSSSLQDDLFDLLNRPHTIMQIVHRPIGEAPDATCPLHLCTHVKAIVSMPDRPSQFLACLENSQFCGVCPGGTIFHAQDQQIRCLPSIDTLENNTQDCEINVLCEFDFTQRLRVAVSNDTTEFIICSKGLSFCGYCPQETSTFNGTTLTCDDRFPQTKLLCDDAPTMTVMPDPLANCSPLAYVCLPGRQRGIPIRCADARMRHNQWHMTCAFPEHVPECGGQLQPYDNTTLLEIELRFNGTELGPRGGPGQHCVANCMMQFRVPKNTCIRMCSS